MQEATPQTAARIAALEAEQERLRRELDALFAVLRAIGAPSPAPRRNLMVVR